MHNDAASTIIISYNRRGNLLASGTVEGTIFIWDMDTHSISLRLKGHVQPVTSLRCRDYLTQLDAQRPVHPLFVAGLELYNLGSADG
jgi:WD40 repeat protein